MTAVDLLQKRKSVVKVTTGSDSLDSILSGGIESGSITEVFGEFRTGKSQLAHTLCVTSQLPKDHRGGNGKVAFIDTDGTFRPERIVPIAERFGIDPMMTLENIVYARAFSHEQQDALVTTIASRMVNDQFAMLIIDSFTSLFRVEFVGREELAPRQQAIASLMNKLIKVATEFNIAVLITNQVMADPSGGSSALAGGDTKKPVGGHVIAHASTTRLSLRKGIGGKRICKIYDSPCLPESEATFCITNGGVADATS
jgi:meiotic recombination protein DMC1